MFVDLRYGTAGCPLLKSANDNDDDDDYCPGSRSTTLVTSIAIRFAASVVFIQVCVPPQNTSSFQTDRQMTESASGNGSTGKLEYSTAVEQLHA